MEPSDGVPDPQQIGRKDLRGLLDDYERRLILLALDAAGGHQRRAASSLGILPSTLSEKMKRLGLRSSPRMAWRAAALALAAREDGGRPIG
jgi:DNA-binding NtrC family response regulator